VGTMDVGTMDVGTMDVGTMDVGTMDVMVHQAQRVERGAQRVRTSAVQRDLSRPQR
jgi:hypothetical protein